MSAVVAVSAGVPVAAGAAPPRLTPAAAPIIPGRPSSISFSSVTLAGPQRAAAVITCTLHADNPHDSGHVNRTINTSATASCRGGNNGNVTSIDVTVRLLRSEVTKMTGSAGTTGRNNASASANAPVPCKGNSPGSFRGDAGAFIVPPPGYRPSSATLYSTSITLGVTCGLSLA